MRCCKRRKLLTSDVKSALQTCDAPPVYGHDGDDSTKFVFVPDADVYVTEEAEVDLISVALGSETYSQTKPPCISSKSLAVHGTMYYFLCVLEIWEFLNWEFSSFENI